MYIYIYIYIFICVYIYIYRVHRGNFPEISRETIRLTFLSTLTLPYPFVTPSLQPPWPPYLLCRHVTFEFTVPRGSRTPTLAKGGFVVRGIGLQPLWNKVNHDDVRTNLRHFVPDLNQKGPPGLSRSYYELGPILMY